MRPLPVVFMLLSIGFLAGTADASGGPYGWTISTSSTDPYANTSTPTFGVRTVFLWFTCSAEAPNGPGGMASATFQIISSGVVHLATIPQNGFLNAGSTSDLLLAVGSCPEGPIVAARLLITDLPGSMCLGPSGIKGFMGTVDCRPAPDVWPMEWIGYDNSGAAPCSKGTATCEMSGPLVDAGPNLTACSGDPTQIGGDPTAQGGTPPYTYSWTPTTGLDDPTIANPTATATATTTYTVMVTDAALETGTNSMTLSINLNPIVDAGPDLPVCPGGSVEIGGTPTAAGGLPPYSYLWSPAVGLSNPFIPNPGAMPDTTTTYTVIVTDSNGCQDSASMTVTVVSDPLVADAGPDEIVCSGVSTEIGGAPTATGGAPPYIYQWSPTIGLDDPSSANPIASPFATTVYVILVIDASGCSASDTVTVTVNPYVTADAGPNSAIPLGGAVMLGGSPTAFGGTPPFSYDWTPGAGLDDPTSSNPTATPTATTTYTVTVMDAGGCEDSDTVTVTVAGSRVLYGCDRDGSLFIVDCTTGAGTFVCALSSFSTEIEYDFANTRAISQLPNGGHAHREFTIFDCADLGPLVSNGHAFNGMEYVDGELYATSILSQCGASELRILDPATGMSTLIGPTGLGPISGLAWDHTSSTMYGVTGCGAAGPADLVTIDLFTGEATVVGNTGQRLGSCEFGPDGELYGGGDQANGGNIYRIDLSTGLATLVGWSGFNSVTGLTFFGPPPSLSICPVDVEVIVGLGEVSLPIVIEDPSSPVIDPIGAFGLDLQFDETYLTFVDVLPSGFTSGFEQFDGTLLSSGTVRLGGFAAAPLTPSNPDTLAYVVFEVDPAATGIASVQTTNIVDVDAPDCAGSITFVECLADGDVDENGHLNPNDAFCAFQCALNGGVVPPECVTGSGCETVAADVNCDGSCTPGDALWIFERYLCDGPPEHCGGTEPACVGPGGFDDPARVAQLRLVPSDLTFRDRFVIPVEVIGWGTLRAFSLELIPSSPFHVFGFERSEATDDWVAHDYGLPSGRIAMGGFDPIGTLLSSTEWTTLGFLVARIPDGGMSNLSFDLANATDDLVDVAFFGSSVASPLGASVTEFSTRVRPNPSSGEVRIACAIPGTAPQWVDLKIYNVQGRLVRALAHELRAAGEHELTWNGEDDQGRAVAPGTYFYRVQAGAFRETRKIVRTR